MYSWQQICPEYLKITNDQLNNLLVFILNESLTIKRWNVFIVWEQRVVWTEPKSQAAERDEILIQLGLQLEDIHWVETRALLQRAERVCDIMVVITPDGPFSPPPTPSNPHTHITTVSRRSSPYCAMCILITSRTVWIKHLGLECWLCLAKWNMAYRFRVLLTFVWKTLRGAFGFVTYVPCLQITFYEQFHLLRRSVVKCYEPNRKS